MNRGSTVCLMIFIMLGASPLSAQNLTFNECSPQSLSFADCLDRYEREVGFGNRDLVKPLTRLATNSFLRRQFRETDRALNLAREVLRQNEGLFTRSQIPYLIMQAENLSNSADWAEARKLQDHLIWLFQSKFSTPDHAMIDELQAMSRLHLRGAGTDNAAYRAYHFVGALRTNRLAIDVANVLWETNDGRKAELIHERLRILYIRASQAMKKGLVLSAAQSGESFAGNMVLSLSEKLTLGDMRRAGDRYIEQFRQLAGGSGGEALELLGIAGLYKADWLLLFDRNADVTDIQREAGSLLERAGVSRKAMDDLMDRPLLQPEMEYYASVEQILRARSLQASAGAGMPEAFSFASTKLRPFADLVYGASNLSASVAAE